MIEIPINQANTLTADVVAASDNSAITSGTVAAYLYCKSGDVTKNGKWWNGSAWAASFTSAGNMTHRTGDTNGQWDIEIAAGAFDEIGAVYSFSWIESGTLHIPVSIDVVAIGAGQGVPSLGD